MPDTLNPSKSASQPDDAKSLLDSQTTVPTNSADSKTPEEVGMLGRATGDTPTDTDKLGFKPYVDAVYAYLTEKETKTPLTFSVEGDWGSGKSSFMLQLEKQLRDNRFPTMRFNAWRHDKEDALYAAFALELIRQLSKDQPPLQRYFAKLKLLTLRWNRNENPETANSLVRASLFTLVLLFILVAAAVLTGRHGADFMSQLTSKLPTGWRDTVRILIGTGGFLGFIGVFAALFERAHRIITAPLKINIEKYLDRPDYASRVAFVERFHEDFQRIIAAYSGKEKKNVYIFMDDIDRIEVPRAADLVQAINMMVSDTPQVIFIIGMDREKVAASLAVKHEKLLPYIAPSQSSRATQEGASFDASAGLEYGYAFMEKFIHVAFRVPKPTDQGIQVLLTELGAASGTVEQVPDPPLPHDQIQKKFRKISLKTSAESEHIRTMVREVAPFLEFNPRRIKQFVSLLRLRAYIADSTGLFDAPQNPLTLEMLGKFIAINLQWPSLLLALEEDGWLLSRLQYIAGDPGLLTKIQSNTAETERSDEDREFHLYPETDRQRELTQRWATRHTLLELLRVGVESPHKEKIDYRAAASFAGYNTAKLMDVSPGRKGSSERQHPADTVNNPSASASQAGTADYVTGGTEEPASPRSNTGPVTTKSSSEHNASGYDSPGSSRSGADASDRKNASL